MSEAVKHMLRKYVMGFEFEACPRGNTVQSRFWSVHQLTPLLHHSPIIRRGDDQLVLCSISGVIVVHLYAKEPKAAWQVFQDALTVDCFVSSEEAFAADDLFNAYRSVE